MRSDISLRLVICGGILAVGALFVEARAESARQAAATPREELSLDRGWRFHLGDIAFPVISGHEVSYNNAKAGKAWGAADPNYDDSKWRELDLPHDWAVEGPFDKNANLAQGFRPRGIAWYRRHFTLSKEDRGKNLELKFDGIATYATVWLNGSVVHRNWCGYTSFSVDLTPYAKYGREVNTIVIRVDAEAQEGWWYEGAGIYRHTWLIKRNPVYIPTDGVFANPVRDAAGKWSVPVEITLANSGKEAATVEAEFTLLDPDGKEVARSSGNTATVLPLNESVVKFAVPVVSPRLWSVDRPELYSVRVAVSRDGKTLDAVSQTCGFRTIRFDADEGFFLNDKHLKIQGVCNHQDHAGVGVAVPDSLWEFRLRRLKEMGANAYRCSHNPPAKEFLDACDRMGILVMDENRNFNSTPEYVRQLEWMVRRDRNHPSVILWSVFNEEPTQGSEVGYEMVRRLSAAVKRLDVSRPVTAAMSGGFTSSINVSQAVDVGGINYQIPIYDQVHKDNPKLPLTSSEDTSCFMTRGEYVTDKKNNVCDSYDTQHGHWGATHRDAWRAISERKFLAGGFVWTGFDYRGEPTPYRWPSAGSFFGAMDLCGFPKSAYYIHQAHWIDSRPILQITPHWNWAGQEGKPIKVMVISNSDVVRLSLNGKLIGEKKNDKIDMVSWDVPYEPGTLEAVALDGGKEVARSAVETVGAPVALRLTPDRATLAGDGWDTMPITVEALDEKGRPVPTANSPLEFSIEGPGEIIGHGNGDPNCHEPEKGNRRSLFNGLAQVIVRSAYDSVGRLTLLAKSPGLKDAVISVEVKRADVHPFVPASIKSYALSGWRVSKVTKEKPDANQKIAENDMNSWESVQIGRAISFKNGTWAVYRIVFTPKVSVQESGGQIVFSNILGKAEIWLDGKLVGKKEKVERSAFNVPLPGGAGERTINVLIEVQDEGRGGLGGPVFVEPTSKP